MVTKEDTARIRTIVERAYRDYFGDHDYELMLEAGVGYYGHDIMHVVFVFDEEPPGLDGRTIVDFKGQANDEKDEAALPGDLIFEFHPRAELDEAMAELAGR